jgi:hypothetical protein
MLARWTTPVLLLFVYCFGKAQAQPYGIDWNGLGITVKGTGGVYSVSGIVGQLAVGQAKGADYFIASGYWAIAAAGPSPMAGMVGWWRGEANGEDIIGENNGTRNSITGFGTGYVGQAFLFGAAMPIADSPALRFDTQFTIEAWVSSLPYSPPDGQVRTIFGRFGVNRSYRLCVVSSNGRWQLQLHLSSDGSSFSGPPDQDSLMIPTNTIWTHVAGTFENGTMNLFINGSLAYSGTGYPSVLFTGGPIVPTIGGDASGDPFSGSIDELAVFDRSITADEINQIYSVGPQGKYGLPPDIFPQPASQTNRIGGSTSFNAWATSVTDVSYQWQFKGTNISGATNSSYILTNLHVADMGAYSVAVSNKRGSMQSSNATLTVVDCSLASLAPATLPVGCVGAGYNAQLTAYNTFGSNYFSLSSGALPPGMGLSSDGLIAGIPTSLGNFQFAVTATNAAGCVATTNYALLVSCPAYALNLVTNGSGSITAAPVQTAYAPGSTVSLTATPGAGCPFVGWSGDANGTNNPLSVVMDSNKTISANFTTNGRLTVTVVGGGTVLKSPDQAIYPANSTVVLKALPASGWAFAGWSDVTATGDQLVLIICTDKSVTAIFTNNGLGCAVVPSGIVSWWPAAGNANDIISTNNGFLTNGASIVAGFAGQAFSRDGTNALIYVPNSANLQFPTQFTIEAWVRPNEVTNTQQIFALFDQRGAACLLETSTNGTLVLEMSDGVSSYDSLDTPTYYYILAGSWSHVAATFNAPVMSLYISGLLVATKSSMVSGPVFTTPTAAAIGGVSQPPREAFSGLIDEPAVYDRALLASEIQAIANAGKAGKCLAPLYITSVNRSGGTVDLSWLSQPEMVYHLQYKTNLEDPTWNDVGGDVMAASNSASATDITPGNDPTRFYRVRMVR